MPTQSILKCKVMLEQLSRNIFSIAGAYMFYLVDLQSV